MKRNVLITGANGFIGSHLVSLFTRHGVAVTCFVRRGSDLSDIQGYAVEYKYGDIGNRASLIEALQGHDFVIHNAGYVKDWGEYQSFYQTNVEGVLNVLEACVANGIKDVIMTGTNAVYGEEPSFKVKDEASPYQAHYPYFLDRIFPCCLNHYRDTKCLAAERAMDFARREAINLTVLDPVWVYGENGRHTVFLEYIRSVEQGVAVAPGSRKNKFHVIYAPDLAEAYYLAFIRRLRGVQHLIIADTDCAGMDHIFSLFCRYAGVKKPLLLPKWLVYPAGFLMELVYTLLKMKVPPLLTRGRVNMFYDNIEYATHKAEEVLGFRTRYSLDEGIRNTVKWYRQAGGL